MVMIKIVILIITQETWSAVQKPVYSIEMKMQCGVNSMEMKIMKMKIIGC